MNIRELAKMMRLDLTNEEFDDLEPQLSVVLEYVSQVQEAPVNGVAPTSHAVGLTNVFRDDTVRESLSAEDALGMAPEVELSRFKVPRMLTEE